MITQTLAMHNAALNQFNVELGADSSLSERLAAEALSRWTPWSDQWLDEHPDVSLPALNLHGLGLRHRLCWAKPPAHEFLTHLTGFDPKTGKAVAHARKAADGTWEAEFEGQFRVEGHQNYGAACSHLERLVGFSRPAEN